MQLSAFNSWFTFPCRVLHMQSLYVENAMVEIMKYAGSGADKLMGCCQDRDR